MKENLRTPDTPKYLNFVATRNEKMTPYKTLQGNNNPLLMLVLMKFLHNSDAHVSLEELRENSSDKRVYLKTTINSSKTLHTYWKNLVETRFTHCYDESQDE